MKNNILVVSLTIISFFVFLGLLSDKGHSLNFTCTDTDSSTYPTDNKNLKGTANVSSQGGTISRLYQDLCTSSRKLNESVCLVPYPGEFYNVFTTKVYDCSNGCIDGRCQQGGGGTPRKIPVLSPSNSSWTIGIVLILFLLAIMIYFNKKKSKKNKR